jgi:aminoglycoside phosphotransferase (APT) family kinase protein
VFEINEETKRIAKIIFDEFAEKSLKISPVTGKGFVNDVYLVETENSKFILRTKNAGSPDEYEKEKWAADQARRHGIPTPAILKIGVFDDRAYSIQNFVAGIEGRDLTIDRHFIWKKSGEYAKRIHEIKVGGFGLNFRDMTAGDSKTLWLEYLDYNIESLNERDELLKLGVLTRPRSKFFKKLFGTLRTREFRFGLNHGDLSLKNTIVDGNGIIYLIDWGSAEAAIVPHHELLQLLKMNRLENEPNGAEITAFLDGYGLSSREYEEMLPDLKTLSILRAFDKLRWAIDRKIPGLPEYVAEARKTVDEYY